MATVRQLTTRFSFETDRSGIRKFNQSVGSMKKTVVALGAAFAGSKVVQALVRLGTGMESSVNRARRFGAAVQFLRNNTVRLTGDIANSWKQVANAIPGRVVLSDFLNGFADFKQFLKDGTMEQFNKLFIAAGRIAKISGEPVAEVFRNLTEAAKSGDLSILQKVFKGLDVKDVSLQNFIRQLSEFDPTGVATVDQRIRRIFKVIKDNEKELDAFARKTVFGTFGGQTAEFKANLRNMGEIIGAQITRPMIGALLATNKFFDEWAARGFTWKGLVKTMESRSKLFALSLEVVGEATSLMGRMLDDVLRRAKEGYDKLAQSIDERGTGGTFKLILKNMVNDFNNFMKEKFPSLGGINPNDPISQRMKRTRDNQMRVDFRKTQGITNQRVDSRGNIVIINAPITVIAKDPEDAGQAVKRIIQSARDSYRPLEDSGQGSR